LVRARRNRSLPPGVLRLTPREGTSITETLQNNRFIADNLQTRMLCSDPGAWKKWRTPLDSAALDEAKANLRDRFLAFGLTERFDESLRVILTALRLTIPAATERLRVGNHPAVSDLSPQDQRALAAHNRLDGDLYDFARGLFA
jgi:hypothetical protein